MPIKNQFNLTNEPWIPIADVGRVSLKQIFTKPHYRALGGNAIQKIALTKLLLTISQAAYTPEDNEAWETLTTDELAQHCLAYLETQHDNFWLYGEKPFLQMPAIAQAEIKSFGVTLPEIATGNTTILNSIQIEKSFEDADKALLIAQLMGFGLGGGKADNSVILSNGYIGKTNPKGKPSTGKPGASLGFMGFLHSFLQGETLLQTLWLNLLTQQEIQSLPYQSLGIPPWEKMPEGEDCATAKQLKTTLIGRLIPLSRFCLLNDGGLHYSEGLSHADYKTGWVDPSVALKAGTKPAVLWVDTERRPWRYLTSLLSFMGAGGFECYYLKLGLERLSEVNINQIGIWSGGLRVSSNAGEQYVSGSDDFVESVCFFSKKDLDRSWYTRFEQEMTELDQLAKIVYASVLNYFKSQKAEGKNQAAHASNLFWQLCEQKSQQLIYICEEKGEEGKAKRLALRQVFANFARTAYNAYCPNDTAKQLNAWAENLPHFSKYLKHDQPQSAKEATA